MNPAIHYYKLYFSLDHVEFSNIATVEEEEKAKIIIDAIKEEETKKIKGGWISKKPNRL